MQILKVIGLLMEYPDELLWECKEDALALIRRDAPILTDFTRNLLNAPLLDKQAEWCEVFDRGRTTSLLLFEHVHAESRDRGQAMVDLLAEYEKVGLQLNCRELPDYLPLYLEYLSVLPDDQAKEGLLNVAPILALLGGRLKQREAPCTRYLTPCCNWQEALCQVTVSQNRFAVKSVTTPTRRWMRCGKKNR